MFALLMPERRLVYYRRGSQFQYADDIPGAGPHATRPFAARAG